MLIVPDSWTDSLRDALTTVIDDLRGKLDSLDENEPDSPDEDEQLIREIAQNLVVRAGWGVDPDRDALEQRAASTLHDALEAQGTAGTFDPVAGVRVTPARLAANIRTALNLSDSDPVGWAQVVAVMQEVLQDQDPFTGFETIELVQQMPLGLRPVWQASDPDEAGQDLDSLAAEIEADVLFGPPDRARDLAIASPAATAAMAPIKASELIRAAMRRNKRFFSELLKPSTQQTGNEVERIIQADYILQHPGHIVLMDTFIWDTALQAWTALGGTFDQDRVKNLLTSTTGSQNKPDICDLTSREVFEIKPFRKVFLGLAQLYLKYLVPLNVGIFGYATAKAILDSIDPTGAVTAAVSTSEKPFLPGVDFKSPRWYPLENGSWAFVMLVAPGVIGYEVVSEIGEEAYEPATVKSAREKIIDAMAAMIAAAAAAAGARNVSGRPFTPDDLPPLFTPSPDAQPVDLVPVIVASILFVAIIGLAAAVGPEVLLPKVSPIPLPVLSG